MQAKFKNVYEETKEHKGTKNIMLNADDKANQARAEEVELKNIIKKYGIVPIEYLNSTKEPLYLDTRGTELTINERLKQKQDIDNYFDSMPAKIREKYKSNKELFYEELMYGNHNQLISDGVLTREHSSELINKRNEAQNKINDLQNQLKNLTTQINNLQKGELTNEIQTN